MILNAATSRADLGAACRAYEAIGPDMADPPCPAIIRDVLIDKRTTDGTGNDFAAMWDTDAMDRFQEAIFTDYDRCADLFKLIGQHADESPLLSASLDGLAQDLAEEL